MSFCFAAVLPDGQQRTGTTRTQLSGARAASSTDAHRRKM